MCIGEFLNLTLPFHYSGDRQTIDNTLREKDDELVRVSQERNDAQWRLVIIILL